MIDIATGEFSELSNENLEFDGREIPKQLEILEDGIFLYSDQNVAKYNFIGRLSFQKYYVAPKEVGWKRALLYAASVRAAYIGAVSHYVSGSIASAEGGIRQKDAVEGEITSQIGTAYGA